MIYEGIIRNHNNIVEKKDEIHVSFILGPKVSIIGDSGNSYKVQFIDKKNNFIHFQTEIKSNNWAKAIIEYFVDWRVRVWLGDKLIHQEDYDATNKRVYIQFGSKSLGDTLAWFPYVDEFRKKHNCEVIVSTFLNDLFEDMYGNLIFSEITEPVEHIYAQYNIGLYYKENDEVNYFKNPQDPKTIPMQQIATDILGLEYKEIKPKLYIPKVQKKRLVTIAIHGTAQAKYWNNQTGWQEVVDYLIDKGYEVRLLSREGDGYMGNKHPNGITIHPVGSLQSVITQLKKSKFFIGIGSGLSWLSWATNTPTVLISGFSEHWTEMKDCIRITAPEGKCSGCFNRIRLDAGDWNWCPDLKGTDRQFECTKSITGQDVIKQIEEAGLL